MAKAKIELPLVADPSEASAEHALCTKCRLHETCNNPFLPIRVADNWDGQYLLVLDAPTRNEDTLGRLHIRNDVGQLLVSCGLESRNAALAYATRCKGEATLRQLRLCRPFLVHEIQRIRPKWVLCIGEAAAKSVLNTGRITMSDYRQRLWHLPEDATINVAVTVDPSGLDKKEWRIAEQKIRDDLRWVQTFTGYVEPPKHPDWPEPDAPAVGFDTEFEGARLVTVGLAWGDKAISHENGVTNWTPSSKQYCVGHNVYDDIAIAHINGANLPRGWKDGTRVLDTVSLARLVDENRGSYDLESCAVDLLNIQPWKKPTEDIGYKCLEWPTDLRMERCRLDAWATASLAKHLLPKLDKKLVHFQHVLAASLNRIEMAGVKVDLEQFGKIRKLLCKTMGQRALSLLGLVKSGGWPDSEKFSFSNDNHMRKLLFDIMGQKPQKLTAKSKEPAVDKTALVLLYQTLSPDNTAREVISARLKYEKLEKLVSTYVVGVDKRLSSNGYLFPSINPLGARTGRRSQSDPNLQNWPKKIRQMIVSRWPNGRLVCGDFSQLEPRILAEHAGIDAWQEMFRKGKSLYIEAAKMLWKRDIEKDTPLYKLTKSTILGTNYGMEVDLFIEKLATEQGVRLSRDDGEYVLSLYHNTFPQLPRFFALQKERILNRGYVETTSGQRRHLACPEGERTPGFKHMWNEAVNFPIQGDAALIAGSAIIDLERSMLAEYGVSLDEAYDFLVRWWAEEKRGFVTDTKVSWDTFRAPVLINEVHDELVVDVPDERVAKRVEELMKGAMETCPTLRQLWPKTRDWVLKVEPVTQLRWGQ